MSPHAKRKPAESILIVSANFLSVLQLAIISLRSTSLHEHSDNHQIQQQTGGTCSLCVHKQTGPPPQRVFCPDWLKSAGTPGHYWDKNHLQQLYEWCSPIWIQKISWSSPKHMVLRWSVSLKLLLFYIQYITAYSNAVKMNDLTKYM